MKLKDTTLKEKLVEKYDDNRAEFNTIVSQSITAMKLVESGKMNAMNDIVAYPLRVFSNRIHPKIVWDVLVLLHEREEELEKLKKSQA